MTTLFDELDDLRVVCRKSDDITTRTLDLYVERLADLPESQVVQAIRELSKTSTFFPSLAEIRNRVVAIIGEAVLVDAESAWGEVMREVRRVGITGKRTSFMGGQSVVIAERQFSSPMLEKAVDSIGWESFCTVNPEKADEVNTLRAQLRDAIRVTQKREVDRIVSGRAIGTGLTEITAGSWKRLGSGKESA